MHGQLLPVRGGDPIPLLKTHLIVGRRERCDIVLDYPNISLQHAELEFRDGYWRVRDLSSKVAVEIGDDDPGAFACKRFAVLAADSRCASGDDHDAIVQAPLDGIEARCRHARMPTNQSGFT